jgi:hypothetical protein
MTSVEGMAIPNISVGYRACSDYHQDVKRALKHLLLSVLLIVEALLLTAFLPEKIQQRMNRWIFKEQPPAQYDFSTVTEPNFKQEISFLRPYALAVDGTLILVNGVAIVVLWGRRNT